MVVGDAGLGPRHPGGRAVFSYVCHHRAGHRRPVFYPLWLLLGEAFPDGGALSRGQLALLGGWHLRLLHICWFRHCHVCGIGVARLSLCTGSKRVGNPRG